MPKWNKKQRALDSDLWIIYSVSFILLSVIWYYQWMLGLLMTLFLVASIYYIIKTEKSISVETAKYNPTYWPRMKKVGEEALLEMSIGIILYSDDYQVEWANPYMNKFTEDDTIVGKSLDTISEQLIPLINENKDATWITLDELVFLVT